MNTFWGGMTFIAVLNIANRQSPVTDRWPDWMLWGLSIGWGAYSGFRGYKVF